MSKSDYYRPAEWQIRQCAKCDSCGRESEFDSQQNIDGQKCFCGGMWRVTGESYPAEQRDPDGEWRARR